jgi:hypothetical protein
MASVGRRASNKDRQFLYHLFVYHDTAIQSEVSAKLSKKTYETEEEKEKEMDSVEDLF